jgi:hypothetical protein
VLDEVNRDAAREWSAEDRGREDRPRRDDRARRDNYRHRQEDLGPSVVGFGDAVPAFMLIPVPRPKRAPENEAEAA